MDIRKIIYDKLSADTELIKLLPDNRIYTAVSDDAGTYPVVVLSIIDDVPSLHADDMEIHSDVRFQLTIITDDGEYDVIEQLIKNDMTGFNSRCTCVQRRGKATGRTIEHHVSIHAAHACCDICTAIRI